MVKAKTTKKAVVVGGTELAAKVNGTVVEVGRGRGRKRPISKNIEAKKIKVDLTCEAVEEGTILSVGMGDTGQLGLGPDVEEKSRPAVVNAVQDIVCIAAGGMHSVCTDKNGKVYTWGCNDEGALGRPTSSEEENFTPSVVPLEGQVIQVAAGDCHTAALTRDGTVYAWGCFRDNCGPLGFFEKNCIQRTPRQVGMRVPIVKLASGNNHLALLSAEGHIYTCGCGECGQLGRIAEAFAHRNSRNRNGIETLLHVMPLKVFKSRKPVLFDDVWAGGFATFARAKVTGDIYAFGLNNYCQLGDEDTNMKFQPAIIKALRGKKWKMFACGQHHSIALEENGNVYAMGRYDYGRLGLGMRKKDATSPTLIEALSSKRAVKVSAGECVSFVVTDKGEAFGFGMGSNNQLAQGNDDDCHEPVLLGGKQLAERLVVDASAGGQHTILLAIPKKDC